MVKPNANKAKASKKQSKPQLKDVPLPDELEQGDGSEEIELSEEDIEFVQQNAKKIGFLESLDEDVLNKSIKQKQKEEVVKQHKGQATRDTDSDAESGSGSDDEDDDKQPKKKAKASKKEEEDSEDELGVQAYEKGPRVRSQDKGPKSKGLPVKTLDGGVMYEDDGDRPGPKAASKPLPRASEAIQVEGVIVEDELEVTLKKREQEAAAKAEEAAKEAAEKKARKDKAAAESALPPALAALKALRDKEQRRVKAREAMAVSASKLLSGPEEAMGEFKTLLGLLKDDDVQVSRLAMMSLLAVFKDIAPGYRIRPPTEKELQVKVSKDVQKLRDYESALLKYYQGFLKHLLACSKTDTADNHKKKHKNQKGKTHNNTQQQPQQQHDKNWLATARIAVRCMCQLLETLPHFNYASDLLQAIVPHMSSKDDQIRGHTCGAIRGLLTTHETHPKLSLEAVQLVADLVKMKRCVCPAEVVQVLSVLRFSEIKPKSEEDDKDAKNKKKDKSKKASKRARTEIDAQVDKDFKESEAGPDLKLAAMVQSQMLEALFEIYFRVLKDCTQSQILTTDLVATAAAAQQAAAATAASTQQQLSQNGKKNKRKRGGSQAEGAGNAAADQISGAVAPGQGVARTRLLSKHPLLYAALEGLGRYAHLISVEYFQDIMDVFQQLLRLPGLPVTERLRLLLTASNILRGQGEALNIDRKELYGQLYSTLLQVGMRGVADDSHLPNVSTSKASQKSDGSNSVSGVDAFIDEPLESDPPGVALLAAVTGQALAGSAAAESAGNANALAAQLAGLPGLETSATKRVEEPTSVLLGGALGQMLCEPKMTDMPRLAAFVKRCVTMACESPTPEAITLLGCCMRLMRRYPRLQGMLEWEGEAPVAGRSWKPDCPDPSEAGALSSCCWELSLLTSHYQPHVAQSAQSILTSFAPTAKPAGNPSDTSSVGPATLSGPLARPGMLRDLSAHYACVASGNFRPGPQAPAGSRKGQKPVNAATSLSKRLLLELVSEEVQEMLQDHGFTISPNESQPVLDLSEDEDMDIGEGEEDGVPSIDEDSAVARALQVQYRTTRRYVVNEELRQEQAKLIDRIQKFQVHLHQQQLLKQKQQQEELQRNKSAIKGVSSAGNGSAAQQVKDSNKDAGGVTKPVGNGVAKAGSKGVQKPVKR